uniref:Wall-associated receptor kinase galacturonan-binding domain-containing protein n=1 Tax=Aegilops tauschii subsp. strangulata TaxID=200361 RepID=A0A453MS45_AEGTS
MHTTCPGIHGNLPVTIMQDCNGTGCCTTQVYSEFARGFDIKFVRHKIGKLKLKAHSNRSSIWDTIDVTSNYASIPWAIAVDEPGPLGNSKDYACLSNHSSSQLAYQYHYTDTPQYHCYCDGGYRGNPYITDGCSRDKGYDPIQRKTNCSRWCGEISVPFPFGLEDGCSARMSFQLNCTNSSLSALLFLDEFDDTAGYSRNYVQYINISGGLVNVKYNLYEAERLSVRVFQDPGLYVASGGVVLQQWAVANLTCHEAQQNKTGYACVSINSICLGVNSEQEYVGYRCKCLAGFDGNPYITDGCKDVDECPRNTMYDTTIKMCVSTKEQNLVLG